MSEYINEDDDVYDSPLDDPTQQHQQAPLHPSQRLPPGQEPAQYFEPTQPHLYTERVRHDPTMPETVPMQGHGGGLEPSDVLDELQFLDYDTLRPPPTPYGSQGMYIRTQNPTVNPQQMLQPGQSGAEHYGPGSSGREQGWSDFSNTPYQRPPHRRHDSAGAADSRYRQGQMVFQRDLRPHARQSSGHIDHRNRPIPSSSRPSYKAVPSQSSSSQPGPSMPVHQGQPRQYYPAMRHQPPVYQPPPPQQYTKQRHQVIKADDDDERWSSRVDNPRSVTGQPTLFPEPVPLYSYPPRQQESYYKPPRGPPPGPMPVQYRPRRQPQPPQAQPRAPAVEGLGIRTDTDDDHYQQQQQQPPPQQGMYDYPPANYDFYGREYGEPLQYPQMPPGFNTWPQYSPVPGGLQQFGLPQEWFGQDLGPGSYPVNPGPSSSNAPGPSQSHMRHHALDQPQVPQLTQPSHHVAEASESRHIPRPPGGYYWNVTTAHHSKRTETRSAAHAKRNIESGLNDTKVPIQLVQPPLSNCVPPNQSALAPDPPPKNKKKSKYTTEQDKLILDLKHQGLGWGEIAKIAKCDKTLAARNRYQVLIGQQGGGTFLWAGDEIKMFRGMLDEAERAKWHYIAEELSRRRGRKFTLEMCHYKIAEMFAEDPLQFGVVRSTKPGDGGVPFPRTEYQDDPPDKEPSPSDDHGNDPPPPSSSAGAAAI